MNDNVFLDTNVLVYAYDGHDRTKQGKARSLLREGVRSGDAVVSAQVLGEFFVAVTRKIAEPMPADEALRVIRLLSIVPVVQIDLALVFQAVTHHQRYQISYWDGLIVAAAERAGCTRVLSEDLNDGQQYGAVIAENPFLPA